MGPLGYISVATAVRETTDHVKRRRAFNGYMREHPIARMYQDARVQKIYGGGNEVLKDVAARSL